MDNPALHASGTAAGPIVPMTGADEAQMTREIGGRVRRARQAAGLSQAALGAALGVSFQQIQKYERGANRIGAARLLHIARTLGTSVPDLLGLADGGTEDAR